MKTIIIVCIVVFGIHYFTEMAKREKLAAQDTELNEPVRRPFNTLFEPTNSKSIKTSTNFKCDGRTHCSQMKSLEEAVYFINNCPGTKMDGNHDGEPCEQKFRLE